MKKNLLKKLKNIISKQDSIKKLLIFKPNENEELVKCR